MEIILALLFGAVAGILAHYVLPGRGRRGVALAPLIGAVVGGASWTSMTWAGSTTANPWLWIVSLALPVVVTFPTVLVLDMRRRHRDTADDVRLGLG